MRTTYYHFIDSTVGIGTTYHTLATGTVNEFGIGISSHIGIGTLPRAGADLAMHHDGSESKRTGGLEINANSDSAGDKHGARILSYNRLFSDKGYRRLRFQASEYQFETPTGGTSHNNAGPTFNITGFGSVGIGTTDPLAQLDIHGDARFNNKIYDKDGDSGTSGQVLSSTGTQVDWVNVGTLSAGSASQVAVTASNDDQNFNVTFVDSSSGNQSIKADTNTNFLYNPSINRLELNTFNGTGLMLSGSGSDYVGMQLKTSDSSASQTRNIFIDTVNELGNAVANQVGSVQSDGGSHWRWETQPSGDRTDRRVERFRITASGNVGIGITNPVAKLDVFGKILAGDSITHANLSNTLDTSVVAGETAFRPINLIDTSSIIKLARVHDDFGPGLDLLSWNANLTTLRGRALISIENGDLKIMMRDGSSTVEKLRITSLGNVGIGTTNTIDTYDGGFERRLVVYGGGAQVGSAYTWTGGDFYHAEDIITAVTKTKSGGFAINCREQEVSATDPSRPIWTLRSYTNEPIAFGQGITEIARFNEDGRLGIGTTNPTSQLTLFERVTNNDGPNTLLTLISDKNDMTSAALSGGQIRFLNQDDNNSGEAFIQANAPDPDSHSGSEASRERTVDFNFKQTNSGTLNTRFTIKGETGHVGIGSEVPAEKLDINAPGAGIGLSIKNSSDFATSGIHIQGARNAGTGIVGQIQFHNRRNNVVDSFIKVNGDGNFFFDKNVGIGSGDPAHKLAVTGNSKLYGSVTIGNNTDISPSASGTGQLRIDGNGYTGYIAVDGTAMYVGHNASARNLVFQTNETDRVTIDSDGYVGIGTDDPDVPLHIMDSSDVVGILSSTNNGANLDLYDNNTQSRIRSVNGKLDLRANAGLSTVHTLPEIRFYVDNDLKFNIDNQGQVIFVPMGQSAINSITPTKGGVVFNSTTNKLQVYDGTAWVNLH